MAINANTPSPQGRMSTTPISNSDSFSKEQPIFNGYLQPHSSIPANKWHRMTDADQQLHYQRTPYSPPTQISKGLQTSNAGGSFTLYDRTGGTKIFTYDPVAGVVTILGSLIAQSSNSGTYSNITLSGTNTIIGTQLNGFYGTPQIVGGSANNISIGTSRMTGGTVNSILQSSGTPGIGTTLTYVKTGTVIGTLVFSGGLLTSST